MIYRRQFLISCAGALLSSCGSNNQPTPPPNVTVPDWVIGNGVITMRASRRFGSAVYSIMVGGIELIDSYDHGRLYQSAWQYDSLGEAYNPTEGGSAADAIGMISSSQIVDVTATSDSLNAVSKPALWQPHADAGSTLEKYVRVGVSHPNLITDTRVFIADADHEHSQIEILTAYMTSSFAKAKSLNVMTGAYGDFVLSDNGAAATSDAIVACTTDESCALALWSPDTGVVMLGQRVAGITKTDIWTDLRDMKLGQRYAYTCFAAAGGLAEVAAALKIAATPYRS